MTTSQTQFSFDLELDLQQDQAMAYEDFGPTDNLEQLYDLGAIAGSWAVSQQTVASLVPNCARCATVAV